MEYCPRGELFDHIVSRGRLSEGESRRFFRQLVSAVAHLHSRRVVHRNINPENVLLDRKGVSDTVTVCVATCQSRYALFRSSMVRDKTQALPPHLTPPPPTIHHDTHPRTS